MQITFCASYIFKHNKRRQSSSNDIRFILSKFADGGLFIGGGAEVRPLFGVPKPALHKAFIEASL